MNAPDNGPGGRLGSGPPDPDSCLVDSSQDVPRPAADPGRTPGVPAVIAVPVATAWVSPDAVRPCDASAVDRQPDTARWVASMSVAERDDLEGRTTTQYLLNDRVVVVDEQADWVLVHPTDQPTSRIANLAGWMPAAHVAWDTDLADPTIVVDAMTTSLSSSPAGPARTRGIPFGTRFVATGNTEPGWTEVVSGGSAHGWLPTADSTAIRSVAGPADLLRFANRFLGVPFMWAGMSPHAVDCSGLIHLCWRRLGVSFPRDADDQEIATTPLDLGDEEPGDLYFFSKDGGPASHVSIVAARPAPDGARSMLHACGQSNSVVLELMPKQRRSTLTGVRRVAL